eukprot:11231718-Prorocentrum_lima.AAC.1
MRRSLEKGLSDRLPPPILEHTNYDTVPPTITLGITLLELVDICTGISASIYHSTPMIPGPFPSTQ